MKTIGNEPGYLPSEASKTKWCCFLLTSLFCLSETFAKALPVHMFLPHFWHQRSRCYEINWYHWIYSSRLFQQWVLQEPRLWQKFPSHHFSIHSQSIYRTNKDFHFPPLVSLLQLIGTNWLPELEIRLNNRERLWKLCFKHDLINVQNTGYMGLCLNLRDMKK